MALNLISNFAAKVAHRNLSRTDEMASGSLAKLSSGTRVNTAADDAASLAIGSRLAAEVAAMRQASVNAGQAGSLLQIADGAYTAVNDILIRMKALSVQSASGQLSSTERSILQSEFLALQNEISRIANDTEFNGVKLISGSATNATVAPSALSSVGIQSVDFSTTVHTQDDNAYRITYDGANNLTLTKLDAAGSGPLTATVDIQAQLDAVMTGNTLTAGTTAQISLTNLGVTFTIDDTFDRTVAIAPVTTNNVVAANAQISALTAAAAFTTTGVTVANAIGALAGLTALDANGAGYDATTGVLRIAVANDTTANAIDFLALAGVDFGSGVATDHTLAAGGEAVSITVATEAIGTLTLSGVTSTTTAATGGFIEINIGQALVYNDYTASGGTTSFTFKIGTGNVTTEDNLTFSINSATASVLAVDSGAIQIDGATGANAETASTAVTAAITTLNNSRALVGAAQNRLSFASANLSTAIENAEAARSELMDLDVASEISFFTSKQVLLQAGVSMLAQANQLPQNLLRLFQ